METSDQKKMLAETDVWHLRIEVGSESDLEVIDIQIPPLKSIRYLQSKKDTEIEIFQVPCFMDKWSRA